MSMKSTGISLEGKKQRIIVGGINDYVYMKLMTHK